jgi:hypothetical protein
MHCKYQLSYMFYPQATYLCTWFGGTCNEVSVLQRAPKVYQVTCRNIQEKSVGTAPRLLDRDNSNRSTRRPPNIKEVIGPSSSSRMTGQSKHFATGGIWSSVLPSLCHTHIGITTTQDSDVNSDRSRTSKAV